jgi:uracil-DNA glycosylase
MPTSAGDGALALLADEIRACTRCVLNPIGRPLPHAPRPVFRVSETATLCIAGQAPGTKVHLTGLPFDDASGDRLRAWMGVDRETFYDASRIAVVPMGFCFPGQDAKGADLPPRRECQPLWHDRLFALLPNLRLVLTIGLYSQRYHLRDLYRGGLTATVADWSSILEATAERGRAVLPLPHPSWRNTAWLKRNPWFEAEVLPVLRRMVAEEIGPSGRAST